MKVLVTGAHFTPALATIEELEKVERVKVVYVGRSTTQEGDKTKSVESQVLPSLGVKFISIIAGRLQREFTIYTIPSLLKIPIGFLQAFFIILTEKPDVILSFGGYVAVPIVIIGWLFSIPIIVHEQTLITGLANKISSLFADKIAVSFEKSEFKGRKVILTGNPVRHEIVKESLGVNRNPPPRWPTVLVMGGNQGSHVINLAVEDILGKLLGVANVYHQTGDSKYRDYERLNQSGCSGDSGKFSPPASLREALQAGGKYKVSKWIGKEYPEILQKADLVVSRAGINSLMEVAILEKPVLIIPIQNKEQKKNAQYFEGLGLAKVLPQSKLTGETLFSNIKQMLKDLDKLNEKAKEAKKMIIPDGAKKLALETMLLVSGD